MSDDPAHDGDLRRRAAWLLGMLVIVAVLIVIIMSTLLGGGGSSDDAGPTPTDPITNTGPPPTTGRTSPTTGATSTGGSSSTSPTGSASSSTPTGASSLPAGASSCPSSAACALSGDVGNALPAINAFRQKSGKDPVPGSVTDAARNCALHRGDGCDGGWAETELSDPDGQLAVQKISQFAKFLDPGMKSIELGWAFDPKSKTYYFATIRRS